MRGRDRETGHTQTSRTERESARYGRGREGGTEGRRERHRLGFVRGCVYGRDRGERDGAYRTEM